MRLNRYGKVVAARGRGVLHPLIAAIRTRFGSDVDRRGQPIVLCCGCERHAARRGALCRACVRRWNEGGWAALPLGPTGEPNPRPAG
jgi:hypothetical protein